VNKSVIVSVRNVLIAAGANEFIVCNIEFMSILMNSLIIESTSILNGITEIIIKKDAWAAYMLKSSPVIFNINFMIFENMSFIVFIKLSPISYYIIIYHILNF